MQIGYNNDVEYRKKTFHIQTEDRGEPSASIETQIFHAGAILDTSIISYTKVLEATTDIDERIERIRALMQGNHKKLYKKLFAGEYDQMVGLEPRADKDAAAVADDFVPSQDIVPAAALEIERGNLQALGNEPEGESMDLAALQAQLNADAAAMEAAQDEAPPTMMLSSQDIAVTQETPAVPRASGILRVADKGAPRALEFPRTGARAWRGCAPSKQELDITQLVEAFAR